MEWICPQPQSIRKSSGFDICVLRFHNACRVAILSTSPKKHIKDSKMHLFSYGEMVELTKDTACEVTAPPNIPYRAQCRTLTPTPTPESSILAEGCVCVCVCVCEGGGERERELFKISNTVIVEDGGMGLHNQLLHLFSRICLPELSPHPLCCSHTGLPVALGHCAISLACQPYTCHVFTWNDFTSSSLFFSALKSSPSFRFQLVKTSIGMAAPSYQVRFPDYILLQHHVPPLPSTFHGRSFSYI